MNFIIMLIMFIFIVSVWANYAHDKDNIAYREYLLELDEIKKRKAARK